MPKRKKTAPKVPATAFRFPKETLRRLKALSEKAYRSQAAELRRLIDAAYEREFKARRK